jgi:hypothetical protein
MTTDAPLPVCLSCHTAVKPEESAVFRNGVRMAHVRCWKLKDAAKPLPSVNDAGRARLHVGGNLSMIQRYPSCPWAPPAGSRTAHGAKPAQWR